MLPKVVTIIEVGPRDGLQNEAVFVPTDLKIKFINLLSQTGLKNIEVTSFVSPKKIPQLADGAEVYRLIDKIPGIHYSALVPNDQGMQSAIAVGVKEIAVFSAASESFTQRNINCSIDESIQRFSSVIHTAHKHQIKVRGYISCVLGCPYEGDIAPAAVSKLATRLYQMGCDDICLGDTIGVGTPQKTQQLIQQILPNIPISQLSMHFHDTYGQALANIYASLQLGVNRFDSSVAGLGGCPYAKGASGNVATEDVLYLMNGLGIETGVDILKTIEVGNTISQILGRRNTSKVAQALTQSEE